jgi:hypothetical protein
MKKKILSLLLAVVVTFGLCINIARLWANPTFITAPTNTPSSITLLTTTTGWTNTNNWLVVAEFINGVTNLVYTNGLGSNVWLTTGGVGVTNTGYLGLIMDANANFTNGTAKCVIRAFGQ